MASLATEKMQAAMTLVLVIDRASFGELRSAVGERKRTLKPKFPKSKFPETSPTQNAWTGLPWAAGFRRECFAGPCCRLRPLPEHLSQKQMSTPPGQNPSESRRPLLRP